VLVATHGSRTDAAEDGCLLSDTIASVGSRSRPDLQATHRDLDGLVAVGQQTAFGLTGLVRVGLSLTSAHT
jgi:hypothetical protein